MTCLIGRCYYCIKVYLLSNKFDLISNFKTHQPTYMCIAQHRHKPFLKVIRPQSFFNTFITIWFLENSN